MKSVDSWIRRDCLRWARGDSKGGEKDEDKGKDGRGDEETKHPMRGRAGKTKSIGDVGRESNCPC